MKAERTPVRKARQQLSQILNAGKTVSLGNEYGYGRTRGFIVGVTPHDCYDRATKRKALKEAKANFTAAWIAESQR